MSTILDSVLRKVVRIGEIDSLSDYNWYGTGILFEDDEVSDFIFLITNKHVIANLTSGVITLYDKNSVLKYIEVEANTADEAFWVGHPEPEIDIAILPISKKMLDENNIALDTFKECDLLSSISFPKMGIGCGSDIFVLGYPISVVTDIEEYPYVRKGIISEIQALNHGDVEYFLIDSYIFPGNSGSALLVTNVEENTTQLKLAGIVRGYLSYNDEAVSSNSGRKVTFEENSGLAVVETIDSLKEIIQLYKSENL